MGDGLTVRAGVVITLGAALVCGVGGCDKLPWPSQNQVDASGPTTAQSAITPSKPVVPPEQVIATVDGVPISKTDVELRIQELKTLLEGAGQSWAPLTSEQVRNVAEELVNTELMAQDAAKRGLERTVSVQQRWEYIRRGFLAQEWLRSRQDQLEVSTEEVQRYYDDNKLGFREPARIRLRQLVVASEDQAKRALTQLHGGAVSFEELAQQISTAPTAAQGGMMASWVMRADDKQAMYGSESDAAAAGVISLDPLLEAAAFAIDAVGNYSSYVHGPDDRYHIFQLVERQDAAQRPIAEVWDSIKAFLIARKLEQALEDLKQSAMIQWSTERLSEVAQ